MHQSWRGNAFSLFSGWAAPESSWWCQEWKLKHPVFGHLIHMYMRRIINQLWYSVRYIPKQFKEVKKVKDVAVCLLSIGLLLVLIPSCCRPNEYLIYYTSYFTNWRTEDSGFFGLFQSFHRLSPSRVRHSTVTKLFPHCVHQETFSIKVAPGIVRKKKGHPIKLEFQINNEYIFRARSFHALFGIYKSICCLPETTNLNI